MKLFKFNLIRIVNKSFFIIFLLALRISFVSSNQRFPKNNDVKKETNKPKPAPVINTDLVPTLEETLKTLNLEHRAKDLYKMGVVDMRIFLRLKKMDFQMMKFEWADVTAEELQKLQDTANTLLIKATTFEEPIDNKDFSDRNKLKFGKFSIPGSVQYFDYLSASFGAPPPMGLKELVIPDSEHGCEPFNEDYKNKFVVIKRGNCTFLEKTLNAKHSGASALIIVNSEDRLDNIASGYGVDKNITESMLRETEVISVVKFSFFF